MRHAALPLSKITLDNGSHRDPRHDNVDRVVCARRDDGGARHQAVAKDPRAQPWLRLGERVRKQKRERGVPGKNARITAAHGVRDTPPP